MGKRKQAEEEQIHEEIRRQLQEEGHHENHERISGEEPARWRAYLIAALGGALLIITLSYFLLAGPAFDGVLSLLTATRQQGLTIHSGTYTIILSPEVEHALKNEYLAKQEREIKACLGGSVSADGATYEIDAIFFPGIVHASVAHITTKGCPPMTLIDLHSHPIGRCIPSETDIATYTRIQAANPQMLMAIMCGTDLFAIYAR